MKWVTWKTVPLPLSEELRKNYGSDFEAIAHITVPREELLSVGEGVDQILKSEKKNITLEVKILLLLSTIETKNSASIFLQADI